jgi:type I restriction enzyme, S subunit
MGNEHWVETELSNIFFTASGGTPSTFKDEYWNRGDIPWINSGALKDIVISEPSKLITKLGLENSSATLFPKHTIVIALTGATTGKLGILDFVCSTNQSVTGIYPNDNYDYMLLFYYLVSIRDSIIGKSLGSAQPHINKNIVDNIKVKLLPLNEQQRIVDKLNTIIPKIKDAKDRIEKIPKILKKFRQSVLAAACSGRLTEEWRETNKEVKSASELLNQIVSCRIKKYKEELIIAAKQGHRRPTKKYLDCIPITDYGFTEEIPETWTHTNIDFLAFVTKLAGFEYTKYIKFTSDGEIPVIRAQNVQMGKFSESNIQYIDKKTSDFLVRSQLFGREVLMVFIGAGTGNVCLAPQNRRWHLAPNVAKIDVDYILNKYLCFYLQSPIGLRNTLSFMKETAQPSLSMETIRKILVALPPLEEQQEIVNRVEKLFAVADSLEAKCKIAISRVENMEQSVLAKAFRGELVESDPNDEPAGEFLKRILVEKEKMEKGKGLGGRNSKTN